ncbi:MAG: MFS transporter [Actinomycetes bacterium]
MRDVGCEVVSATGRREWLGVGVLALTALLLSLDVSVLYLALPRLSADLGADATQQLWILDIYSFLLAGFLVTMGNLGDRIGRRKLLLIGATAFGVASVVAAYATSPGLLIVARAALGVAGATLMPSSMALIRNMFPDPQKMGVAIGVWFSCFMGGMALGPLVGGALLEMFWWGSAFLLGVPFMALLLVTGPVLLPEYRNRAAGRLDLASVLMSLAAILPLVFGLKEVARGGDVRSAVAAVLAGAVFAVLFCRRQRRLADPLLDLSLFTNRTFSTALTIMLLGGVVMAGVSFMATQYLQLVARLSPLEAGTWMLPSNIGLLAGSTLAPVLARRLSMGRVISSGLVICGLGLLLHTQVGQLGGLTLVVTGLTLASFGIMLPATLTMGLLMGAAPPEKAGSAASVSETSAEFGVAAGVAALGSLGTFVYRSQLDSGAPAGVPAAAAEAAGQSLAGAVEVAESLPAHLGVPLLDSAHHAFNDGLNVVGGTGAVIFLVLAAVAAYVVRGEGSTTQAGTSADLDATDESEPTSETATVAA